jgi:3-deoxy-manno-octulosonate cytidylyltransferase (CMP-KDO synthetase)
MQIDAVIPARMGSTRYPGKPLCDIRGFSMIEHVYRRTELSDSVDNTYIATPDGEIRDEVESFGGQVIMTGSHPRATDRVAEAAEDLDSDIVIVMQGDEPLVYPDMIDDAVTPLIEEAEVRCTNLAKSIETKEAYLDPNNVKVVVDEHWNALYFSREPVPHTHDVCFEEIDAYKQVCVIPFEREFLFEFTSMEETTLEKIESIDMLRLLENGYEVRLAETDRNVYAVDTPEDHEKVNEMMKEDELFTVYK